MVDGTDAGPEAHMVAYPGAETLLTVRGIYKAPPFFPPGTPPAPIVPQIRPRPGSAPAGPPTLPPGSWTSESHEQEKPLPTFADVEIQGEGRTAIRLSVEDRVRSRGRRSEAHFLGRR